ncbi:MAG: valine--tRNA ligase, partial [Bifidobacteriaceae bacterium]|nr:valine--tRNA ligase [Bifidobacteriaceae bacterium]
LNSTIAGATDAFENYDHAKALEIIESFFWSFCDNFIELVKTRAYGNEGFSESESQSAKAALFFSLETVLKLLAPFIPYSTEEAWSWFHKSSNSKGSIHKENWPESINGFENKDDVFQIASVVISQIRGLKSVANVSQKTQIKNVKIDADSATAEVIKKGLSDILATGNIIGDILFNESAADSGAAILVKGELV